jgi:hypothetical protein
MKGATWATFSSIHYLRNYLPAHRPHFGRLPADRIIIISAFASLSSGLQVPALFNPLLKVRSLIAKRTEIVIIIYHNTYTNMFKDI